MPSRHIAIGILSACLLVITSAPLLPGVANAQEPCLVRAQRYKAAIEVDVRKRQIAEAVARSLLPDVERAENFCKLGKTADGEKILNNIQKTYGYR